MSAATQSLYSVLAIAPPVAADPGETIETRTRETTDNDRELISVELVSPGGGDER